MTVYLYWCGVLTNILAFTVALAAAWYLFFDWLVPYLGVYRDFAEFMRQKYWRSPVHDDQDATVCPKCNGRGEL